MDLKGRCELLTTNFNILLFPRNYSARRVSELVLDKMTQTGFFNVLVLSHCLSEDFSTERWSIVPYEETEYVNKCLRRSDYLIIFSDLNQLIDTPAIDLERIQARVMILASWGDKLFVALRERIPEYNLYALNRTSLQQSLSKRIRSLPENIQAKLSRTSYRPDSEPTIWRHYWISLSREQSRLIYREADLGKEKLLKFLSLVSAPAVLRAHDLAGNPHVQELLDSEVRKLLHGDLEKSAPKLARFKAYLLENPSDKHLVLGSNQAMLELMLRVLFENENFGLYFPTQSCNDPQLLAFNEARHGICLLTQIPHDLNTSVQHIHVLETYTFDLIRKATNLTLPDNVISYIGIFSPEFGKWRYNTPDMLDYQRMVRRAQVAEEGIYRLLRQAQVVTI